MLKFTVDNKEFMVDVNGRLVMDDVVKVDREKFFTEMKKALSEGLKSGYFEYTDISMYFIGQSLRIDTKTSDRLEVYDPQIGDWEEYVWFDGDTISPSPAYPMNIFWWSKYKTAIEDIMKRVK